MRTLILLLVFNAIVLSAHGRNVLEKEEEDRYDLDWSSDQPERSFPDEDSWAVERSYDADDNFENDEDEFYGDSEIADGSFETEADDTFGIFDSSDDIMYKRYSLTGCSGGKCDICFKIWKLKGRFEAKLTSDGIDIEFKAFGEELYSHKVRTNGSFTLRVEKNKLPKWLRKLISKIEIKGILVLSCPIACFVHSGAKYIIVPVFPGGLGQEEDMYTSAGQGKVCPEDFEMAESLSTLLYAIT